MFGSTLISLGGSLIAKAVDKFKDWRAEKSATASQNTGVIGSVQQTTDREKVEAVRAKAAGTVPPGDYSTTTPPTSKPEQEKSFLQKYGIWIAVAVGAYFLMNQKPKRTYRRRRAPAKKRTYRRRKR